jgi:hypothetical protein
LRLAFGNKSDPNTKNAIVFFEGKSASPAEKQIYEKLKNAQQGDLEAYMSGDKAVNIGRTSGLEEVNGPGDSYVSASYNNGAISDKDMKRGFLTMDHGGSALTGRDLPLILTVQNENGEIKSYAMDAAFVRDNMDRLKQVPFFDSGDGDVVSKMGRITYGLAKHKGWAQHLGHNVDPDKGFAIRIKNDDDPRNQSWVLLTPNSGTEGRGDYQGSKLKAEVIANDDPRLKAAQTQTPSEIQDPETRNSILSNSATQAQVKTALDSIKKPESNTERAEGHAQYQAATDMVYP